ncbi:uncharacterized protein LOC117810922 isoform X2 [Notolabrus celidotus]|uniref:uncharacterized protein LOC117810922 isoform X2 n=1 Tax=Notolabrus celidotus TaxID=1203425 RepID=UPI00148FC18D|nr:uncharacterized protein LOC117810922 isoform X2 [Notolabrus celidotus]
MSGQTAMTSQITTHADMMLLLLVLSALLTGVFSGRRREVHIKAGEMVALQCPYRRGVNHSAADLVWTHHTEQEVDLIRSSAEQRQRGVLVDGRSMVILSVSVNHQGNYSCTYGTPSSRSWFMLTVYSTQSREYEERSTYPKTCYTQESCTLHCPDLYIPNDETPNITSRGITWNKRGEVQPSNSFFPSTEEKDHGVYTCTRSYLYQDQVYNKTFTVLLDVRPGMIPGKAEILSPQQNDVFHVALDSILVVECRAVASSDFDDVFWLSGTSFVERNNSLPVFYNYTRDAEGMKMTASLVFRKVSEEDLSKSYTCKLESDNQPSSFVTITLAQKGGKSHDAAKTGLTEEDRKGQQSVCPRDCNVLPERDAAESV